MAQFLVLARDNGDPRREMGRMSPEEMQRIMGKYMTWSTRIRDAGHLLNSNKLRDGEGRVLRRAGGKVTVTDGPFVESKEVLGGYWLIEAADYAAALALLQDHPHIELWPNASLELRQVHDFTQR
ncbi:MAG TPA: YciI family protein [Stellaceae bacterium]|nr:YciI family protein [Stellaceae bacterium]